MLWVLCSENPAQTTLDSLGQSVGNLRGIKLWKYGTNVSRTKCPPLNPFTNKSDDLFRQIDPLAFFLYTNHHASRFDNPEWVYEVVKDFMLGTKKEPKNDMAKPSPKDEDT